MRGRERERKGISIVLSFVDVSPVDVCIVVDVDVVGFVVVFFCVFEGELVLCNGKKDCLFNSTCSLICSFLSALHFWRSCFSSSLLQLGGVGFLHVSAAL